jgi:hypothetical protein
MAYRANPFLERMSERTRSDQEFVRLFSPKVLERLPQEVFDGAVHIFRSPPGGGKTTLLRAFTPPALRAFWNARRAPEMSESHQRLVARGILDDERGPQMLGVLLSCASGYADLPPGASIAQSGLFRALLNCRIVLRSLRNLVLLLGLPETAELEGIRLEYEDGAHELKHIPLLGSMSDVMRWAEDRERAVYSQLDSISASTERRADPPGDLRLEGVLWLQGLRVFHREAPVSFSRLLMIDDMHKLRRKQRTMLIDELADLRPQIPVWLAERSIALGDDLLAQGVREGRELRQYPLDELWSVGRNQHQFSAFGQNVLDRRLDLQTDIPGPFSQYISDQVVSADVAPQIAQGMETFSEEVALHRSNTRYAAWLAQADVKQHTPSVETLRDLFVTRILISRDRAKRQLTLELGPLSADDLSDRDSSQTQAAAELFMHRELKVPYYYGIDRLCVMATSNIEELLALASALFEGLQAKQILRRPALQLSPAEQEKLLKAVAKKRLEFIPKNHTEGTRALRLLDAIGGFCQERTFLPNAPYAPGVTGVRLSQVELATLAVEHAPLGEGMAILRRVLAECVAENLLVARPSSASTSRDSGTIFYLNRTLCAHYGLPLQMGGWQDVRADEMLEWAERSRTSNRRRRLGIG